MFGIVRGIGSMIGKYQYLLGKVSTSEELYEYNLALCINIYQVRYLRYLMGDYDA